MVEIAIALKVDITSPSRSAHNCGADAIGARDSRVLPGALVAAR